MNIKLTMIITLAISAMAICPMILAAAAPSNPGAVHQSTRDTLDYYRFERRIKKAEQQAAQAESEELVVAPDLQASDTVKQQEVAIQVKRIVTNSSEILSESQLREALAPFENRELTVTQLFAAVEAIHALYRAEGRIAARAVIPAQDVQDGTVKIQLVESRLGQVIVQNNETTRTDYISRRIHTQPGQLVEVSDLEADLRRFNAVHDSKLKAALKPGAEFGTTDYVLSIEEPARYQPLLFIDNAGRDDVGLERIGFSLTNSSLFGRRDRLSIGAHISEDLDQGTKGGSVAYDFPLGHRGTRMALTYDQSNVVVIDGPIKVLNVRGESSNAGLQVRHPVAINPRSQVDWFGAFAVKDSSTDFDGVELFNTSTRTISTGIDVRFQHDAGLSFMRHEVTAGVDEFGGDGTFLRYNGDYTLTQAWDAGIVTTLRLAAQLSSEPLLPSTEQFQLGGIATVRGYEEGLIIGDDGYFVSGELSYPLSSDQQTFRGIVFLDHGGAFPFKGNGEPVDSSDYLTSFGIGVKFSLTRHISGRLAVGIPLNDRNKTDNEDDPTVHFILQAARF